MIAGGATQLVQRMVVKRLARYRGDATESEDCVDREDEHGRAMARLCKDEEEGRVRGELGLAIAEEENG